MKQNSTQLAKGPLSPELLGNNPMGGVIDGDIAIYKDFEVIVEDKHNFMLRHKTDETREIQITMKQNSSGGFDWVGLPACLKL